jgi:hypothetical protein
VVRAARLLRQAEFQRHGLAHGARHAVEGQAELDLGLDVLRPLHGLAQPAHHGHAGLRQFRQDAAVPLAHVAVVGHEQKKNIDPQCCQA